jgi:hypothetical protein
MLFLRALSSHGFRLPYLTAFTCLNIFASFHVSSFSIFVPSYTIPPAMLISFSCHVKSSHYSIFISSFQSSLHLIHFPLRLLLFSFSYSFPCRRTRDEMAKVIFLSNFMLLPYLQWNNSPQVESKVF